MHLALAWYLISPALLPQSVTHSHAADEFSAAHKCECPPDCECHKEGGTCPGDTCSPDCKCDKFYGYYRPYIHPAMREAIKANESKARMGIEDESGDDTLVVDGREVHTGFKPTSDFYRAAKYINVKADPDLIKQFEEKGGLNYQDFSYSPVRGQIQGSCWAEGAASAFELNTNAVLGKKFVFAVNDFIDCSGYGTARSGGQAAYPYAINGVAFDDDYPYTGRDGKCKKDVERHFPLKETAIVRGEDGGFPTEPELLTAFFKYGAMEVCGSAGALSSGGRQDQIRYGSTNHCYALDAARRGEKLGWLSAWYWGIKNSWGDGQNTKWNLSQGDWGDKGRGDYRISKDGKKIEGSVITEIVMGYAGPRIPPVPVTFFIEGQGVNLKITIQPEAMVTQADLTARIQEALKDLEV